MAAGRVPGPVGAQAVGLAGAQTGDKAVKDVAGPLGQGSRRVSRPGVVEQAELDRRGMGRGDGEVDAVRLDARAERPGPAGADGGGRHGTPDRRW